MTLMKTALTMLGTIGLTAGTVLAVAEPTPKPLPDTVPAAACSACQKTASACSKGKCPADQCDAAVSACTIKANACAAGNSDCREEAQRIGIDFVGADACKTAATDCSAEKTGCPEAKTRCLTFGAGISREAGAHGMVVFTAGIDAGECADGACPAERKGCRGHKVVGIEFTDGLTPSVKSRTVFVKHCKRCSESCEAGRCEAASCQDECEATREVAATACEAKPACATSACKTVSCAAPRCATEQCANEEHVARNAEPAADRCESCENCTCESCSCRQETAACPPGPECEEGQCLPWTRSGSRQPQAALHLRNYDSYRAGTVGVEAPHHEESRECQPAGVVRLRSLLAPQFVPTPPILSAPHVLFGRNTFPSMATGAGFEPVHKWLPLMSASFVAPVAAPRPASAPPQARHIVEGTWTRTVGPCTVTFTCEDGRLRGEWTANGTDVRFSGTCSAAPDGQIFGVIDHVELSGEIDEADPTGEEALEARAVALRLIDQPFAVRFRTDGDGLIVKDVRCGGLSPNIEDSDGPCALLESVLLFGCGRYTPAE